jgi:hypothetical protein
MNVTNNGDKMQVGDLVQISPSGRGYSIGIILEQGQRDNGCVLVHWFCPNGLGVASLRAWEHTGDLERI